MKEYKFKETLTFRHFLLQFLVAVFLLFSNCTCDKSFEPNEVEQTDKELMVVYPNSGKVITLVDYKTFEVVKKITVNISDSLDIHRMCLSTNKDYFVFIAIAHNPGFRCYVVSYEIAVDSIHNVFPIGLDSIGAPRITAAHLTSEPGLIYFYTHSHGLFSIDFLTEEVKIISGEHAQYLTKYFYFTSDKKSAAILKQFGKDNPYAEVEFYDIMSGLRNVQFVLNQDNWNGIYIDELAFTEDNKNVLITIRLPQMRYIANYFGSYNLETKQLFTSSLIFPWSINPYYVAYSPKRKEAYLVGGQDKFYIIGIDTEEYYLKDTVDLTDKIPEASRILIRPDENVAFVSCPWNNFVLAVDLENREIINTIAINRPYLLLLL